MQGDRHSAEPTRERDARRGEAAEADDAVGLRFAHELQAEGKTPQLRDDAARQPDGRPGKARAGYADKFKVRVFLDQPRIHFLLADEEPGRVTAGDEPLGQGNSRREMSAGAAAGDEKPAHASTLPSLSFLLILIFLSFPAAAPADITKEEEKEKRDRSPELELNRLTRAPPPWTACGRRAQRGPTCAGC